jgi:hypothetical protein
MSVIATASLLGVGVLAAVLPREPGPQAGIDMVTTGSIVSFGPGFDRYEVRAAGEPTGCVIGRGKAGAADLHEAKVGPGCAALNPALARAREWRDGPDGSMALADGDGAAVMAFSAGDGIDYESYWPKAPLLSLGLAP